MGCCKGKGGSANNDTSTGTLSQIGSDETPDGTKIGKDGSEGGTKPFYSSAGGARMAGNPAGTTVGPLTEHATGAGYKAPKMGNVSPTLGSLSEKYESNGNPGAIGYDSVGGWSYGKYQIATKPGAMVNFLAYEKVNNPSAYSALEAAGGERGALSGSDSFKSTWKQLASNNSQFANDQKGFIQSTSYDVAASKIKNVSGLDINKGSLAVQNAVWSTAVQNGPNSKVFTNAFANKNTSNMSDADIINAIYDERGRTTPSGTLVYFSSSSPAVQKSVANRYKSERQSALAML